jgi:hypothetical protein
MGVYWKELPVCEGEGRNWSHGIRLKWVVSFTTPPLYLRYPLNRWLGAPKSRLRRCGE